MVIKSKKAPHVMFVAPSANILGGVQTWLDYLDPGLTALGWNVTMGLVEGSRYHNPDQYLKAHPHKQWLPIPCHTGTPEGRIRAVAKAIGKVRPDIVLSVNKPDAILAVSRLREAKQCSPRIAMTVHGIQADNYDDISSFKDCLDAVCCTNRLSCALAEQRSGMTSERIYYAQYGVLKPSVRISPSCKNKLRIAFVGRFEEAQKRVLDIPAILVHLNALQIPFELLIAGSGPEEKQLKSELASFIEQGTVKFLGHVPAEDVAAEVFAKVDVMLMPSLWETGPIVIWEAMASGVAVVTSEYVGSGLESSLHHETNVLAFPVGDHQGAAEQLARIWHEPELLKLLVASSYELIEQRYNTKVSVQAWNKVLKSILSSPPLEEYITPDVSAFACGDSRLDRWIGRSFAETIRALVGKQCPDSCPGGEWPHAYGRTAIDDDDFWRISKGLDRSENNASEPI